MRILLAITVLAFAIVGANADAQPIHLDGPGGGTVRASGALCPDTNLYVHHDGDFLMGIAWDHLGVLEPYGGAFGEAFDLGPGTVECVSLWLSQVGDYAHQSTDVYVWEGGVSTEPGAVLAVVTGVVFEDIGVWPDISRHDVEISVAVDGPATVGSWGDWVAGRLGYYWMVDYDGPGHPWTHVAEGTGWPVGWQHPETIWGLPIQSMGIGVHFTPDDPVPVRESSWGEVKRLFAERR